MVKAMNLTRRAFVGAATMCLAPRRAPAWPQASPPPSPPLSVSTLDDWTIVETTAGRHLVGELLVRNAGPAPIDLIELRITGEPAEPLIAQMTQSQLLSRLAGAANSTPRQSLTLAPNDAALIFLWEPLQTAITARVASLLYRSGEAGQTVIGGVVAPLAPPRVGGVNISPPLAGGPWVAVYDPHVPRGHRRVAFPFGQRLVVPARFAVDWVRLDDSGRPTSAAPTDFARWYGFGADVLAVADAKVIAARDRYLDVLTTERPQKRSEDDVSGNYVGLALPGGGFAFYEHLQRGSVRVKVGDSVRAGQPIARLGRTGINSSGPHLHFHVGTDASTLESQGRPFGISEFRVTGGYASMAAALSGVRWSDDTPAAASSTGVVRNVLPKPNSVVIFTNR